MKIQNFTDLNCWQKGHALLLLVYKATSRFPASEQFGLTSQIRRAVLSITSNIAEGFGRSSLREKVQFYNIALGSVVEVQNQLIASRDLGLIEKKNFDLAWELTIETHKMINGLIKSLKSSY